MSGSGISQERLEALRKLMEQAGLREADLKESFVRSSGPGGQHVNKTSSAVLLVHTPTGRSVRAETSRSQALNRYYARKRLATAILEERAGKASKAEQAREKIRRQKRRRSRRSKNRMLEDKAHRAKQISTRKAPKGDD